METMIEGDEELGKIAAELARKREEWRTVRDRKLRIKEELFRKGMEKKEIRAHKDYKSLEKEQSHLSAVIKHIEKRLNRRTARIQARKA